jgi:virginiamycin B lyase
MSKRSVLLATVAALCWLRPVFSQDLPEGDGKQTVQAACTKCHDLERLKNGYTPEEWRSLLAVMVSFGAAVPKDQMASVTDYLTKNFPDHSPKPALVPGPVEVSIKEWTVPTPGSLPHDPMAAPDGSIWYTGMAANTLGRFDPRTQTFKEFPLPANSGPHGLTYDQEGNVWYTANVGGYIGKLNPKNGEITQYKMPDPKAKDPHTPVFDQKGNLWFTVFFANMAGRLIPKTGEIKLVTLPQPRSMPYGIVINSKGVPFFCENGGNRIASINPDTMELKEYMLPNPGARPRRITVGPDDVLWYSDYGRGYLGRLDATSGKVSEWPSPGGEKSRPYGIVAAGNVIWYSEAGVKPNTLVRFDTKSEKFQTWTIPSGGGRVRNMVVAKNGDLWLATSYTNGIARVEVRKTTKTSELR